MIQKEELREAVETILKGAGDIVMSYYQRSFSVHRKKEGSIVTQADLESEAYLLKELKKLIPQACYFAEESGHSGEPNEYCWVIDPLDGTTNFAHGIPYFSISVALTQSDIPLLGATYSPVTNEFFYAIEGVGTYYNNQRVYVSEPTKDANQVFLVAGPTNKSVRSAQIVYDMKGFESRSYSVRHMGSSALDIAYVAAGKAEAVFFQGLSWWDVAAGLLMIRESGGVATTYSGGEVTPSYTDFVAGTAQSYDLVLPCLKQLTQERS